MSGEKKEREAWPPMILCSQCQREFEKKDYVASISGSIMGDEYIESYFLCQYCGVYTIEVCHDRFLGEEEILVRGPVSRSEGDAAIALIKKCSEPWNKKCRCEAHKAYFGGSLD
jgi:hypothetical protein